MMLKIHRFVFSPFVENSYIVWDEESFTGAVIDPGCYDEPERDAFDNFIAQNNIILKYLVNTHCHIDHIFGNAHIKSKYNSVFLAPEKDVLLLELMMDAAKNYRVVLEKSPQPDQLISEADPLMIGKYEGKFLFTPGHTPGEFCLYFETEKICFTGDVLFKGSIGRSDLWGGDHNTLIDSIKTKLFTLPDDVTLYPGHESRTTIKEEKLYNPFLK